MLLNELLHTTYNQQDCVASCLDILYCRSSPSGDTRKHRYSQTSYRNTTRYLSEQLRVSRSNIYILLIWTFWKMSTYNIADRNTDLKVFCRFTLSQTKLNKNILCTIKPCPSFFFFLKGTYYAFPYTPTSKVSTKLRVQTVLFHFVLSKLGSAWLLTE